MKTIKMKSCPFCGRLDTVALVKFHNRVWSVACECGADSPKDSTSANGAIRIWNRRRPEIKP